MHFQVKFNTDSEAFKDYGTGAENIECAKVLREVADRLERLTRFPADHCQPIYDRNGEKVGWFDIKEGQYTSL